MDLQEQAENQEQDVLLKVRGVTKWFPMRKWFFQKDSFVRAVEDISFDVFRGETLGIAGESGCGKSTLARTVLRLLEPTEGTIEFDGKDILDLSSQELRLLRRDMQIVFQDPYDSLHPRMKIGHIIAEPLRISALGYRKDEEILRVQDLLSMVNLDPSLIDRYPHELSGGQRQRVAIARALATNPKLVICDEPVSALDVSVRSQILNLMEEIQEKFNLTYLFISHDLSVIEHICDRVLIMYLGQVVELGKTEHIFENCLHPYTQALLSAIPTVEKSKARERILLEGDIPSPVNPPEGCRFRTRCRFAQDICRVKPEIKGDGHLVACHFVDGSGKSSLLQ